MAGRADGAGTAGTADDRRPGRTGWVFSGDPLAGTPEFWSIAAVAIIVAGLVFNLALSFINAQVFALSGGMVTAVQALIMAAALAVGLLAGDRDGFKWILFLWFAVLLSLILSLFRGDIDPKLLGDAAMIPAFALLGTALRRRDFISFLIGFQGVLVFFAIWEIAAPGNYGATFDITSYYVNTRGFKADDFWSGNDGLFLNVERPTGRLLLPFLGWNRITSVFLEPVSLGNWAAVVTIMIVTFWKDMSVKALVWLSVSNLFLLVACDGRFAVLCQIFILVAAGLSPILPRLWHLLLLPGMIVGLLVLRSVGILVEEGDTFIGRLWTGLDFLMHLDFMGLLGVRGLTSTALADSGWGYLISTQSIFGLIGFWIAICLLIGARTPLSQRYVASAATYVVLLMPISNSFISIKTAAPLFAVYGMLSAAETMRRLSRNAAPEHGRTAQDRKIVLHGGARRQPSTRRFNAPKGATS